MTTSRKTLGICDVCGFRYKLNQLKKNSYGLMVCNNDYDAGYDLKNHPQNKSPRIDERYMIKDIRPDPNIDRNGAWTTVTITFNNNLKYWNLI